MPIDRKHKQAFIHIPKCAGTTIERRYKLQKEHNLYSHNWCEYQYLDICFAPRHLTLDALHHFYPDTKDFNSFCFVRHPYQKAVSEYLYLTARFYKKNIHFLTEFSIRTWLRQQASLFQMDHTLPQWFYAKDCNHIFQVESLDACLPIIDSWFELEEHKNEAKANNNRAQYRTIQGKRTSKEIAENLSQKTKATIASIYRIDFDHLDYDL